MSEFSLDLHDTATAYADKSDAELKEKIRLFRLLNSPVLNSIGTGMTKFALSLGLPIRGHDKGDDLQAVLRRRDDR